LRNRLLQARGLVVVGVPWWEWVAQKRVYCLEAAYLRRLLEVNGVPLGDGVGAGDGANVR
jgi:hypothetical protein